MRRWTSEGTVRPPSGESWGVSVSAKPARKKAKPAEPTTPAPGGVDSEKWASAEDWHIDELEDDANLEDLTKPCEEETKELEKSKAKLKSRMVTLYLEGIIWLKSALRQQLKTPMDKLRKEKAKETIEHVTKYHRTKLKLNTEPCSGCLAGGMCARKAMTGRATKIRQFLTMNSDYIEYPGGRQQWKHEGISLCCAS